MLHIIVEQSLEWNSSLYINFVDHEKTLDILNLETLWMLQQHLMLVNLIRKFYDVEYCSHPWRVVFRVKTGVTQGCLFSSLLIFLVIMKESIR